MTCNGIDNYSNTFFKTVFDDSLDLDFDLKIMLGNFNVAFHHVMDTFGYSNVNNPNTRRFLIE